MLTYSFEGRGREPVYEFLYRKIKEDILAGKLKCGEKLPSKRSLARNLKISVITVENAYAQLMVEGYVYAVEKKGYFVSALEERLPKPVQPAVQESVSPPQKRYEVDFTTNNLVPDYFPFSVWSRMMRKVLAEKNTELLMRSPYQGVEELREEIAKHLYSFRGMAVQKEQIIIGAGTEYLYSHLIQLLGRDKLYAVEDPGYQKIGRIYEKNGVRCAYLPMDEEGLSLEALRASQAQVVHISPAHHFPTGRVMPIRRRQELLRWASRDENRYIIEDDYDSEFRFTGRPIQTLQSIDTREQVIYINTFSKTISPSLRISYLVLPRSLMDRYREELGFYSCTVPSFDQYALASFMRQGYLEQHINRMRNHYRGQRDALIRVIRTSPIAKKLEIMEEDAGLHFLLKIKTYKSQGQLREIAENMGIKITWLEEYYHNAKERGEAVAVVNYSGICEADVKKVERVLREYKNGCIMLEPRELSVPDSISAKTLADMDEAIKNFKNDEISAVIDITE